VWQSYVDDELVCEDLSHAAIIGHDGNPRATSPGFGLRPGEGFEIARLYQRPGDAFAAGVTVGGVRYHVVEAEDRSIHAMKGPGGVICVKTGRAVIIGVYTESRQSSRAATVVRKLADYLLDNGY
jgi:profilin